MSFDQKAKDWDNDPKKTERAKIFGNTIKNFVQPYRVKTAMEVGCGTGLLSFMLQDAFEHITLTDISQGMLDVLQDKIKTHGLTHFHPQLVDVVVHPEAVKPVDVLYTLMTLHHIKDLDQAFETFHSLVLPGGFLCIADLVTEDGSFHGDIPEFVHLGFDRDKLQERFSRYGFEVEHYDIYFTIGKLTEQGVKKFPLFLMIGKKI